MITSVNNSGQTGLNLAQSLPVGYKSVHLTVRGELVEPPATHAEYLDEPVLSAVRSFDKLRTNGVEGVNAVDLSSAKPSPKGEGWVTTARMQEVEQRREQLPRGNQDKEESLFNPPHPNLLPQGEGVRTLKSTALIEGLRTHESFLNVNIIEVAHA